jgi:predicted ATPase
MVVGLAPSFGQLLKQHRLRVGLSQERLAEQSELSVNQISDLERDRRARPHPDTLRRLADALALTEQERGTFVTLARPGRPSQLPPSRSPLPLPLTRFFARPDDLTAVRRRLDSTRLLTLTGAGGVGKTRLALEIAHAVAHDYPDGVWLVDLQALREGCLVPQMVARALGLPEQPAQPVDETVLTALHDRRLLLVVDNCEHLLDACARLLDRVLRYCPGVRILATSREALRLGGEAVWPVQPLALPSARAAATVATLTDSTAVQLFVDRAAAVLPGFALTERNAPTVAEIVRRLDGIPLAIELAAARAATLPLAELAARLDDRFRVLTEGSRANLPRHQTLRAALEWSDALLSAPERTVLWRLSIFAGGWTLAAAEGVVGGDGIPVADIVTLVSRLVAKSLVQLDVSDDRARYRLLETIRQYASEYLAAGDEAATWHRRHADYFLALAEEAEPALTTGERNSWLVQLEEEHDNLRAALRWLIAQGASTAAVRLAAALGQFWQVRRYFREARQWLEQALALRPEVPDAVRARALEQLGELIRNQGDYVAARAALEESRDLFERLGDRRSIAGVLRSLGTIALHQVPPDLERATALFEECLALQRALDYQHGVAVCLFDLGALALEQGEFARAQMYFADALSRTRDLGAERHATIALANLGIVALLAGEDARARALFAEALRRVVLPEDSVVVAYTLAALSGLASRAGRPEQAARLAGASEGVCVSLNYAMPIVHRARFDRQATAARDSLGASAWATAWTTGFALTVEQALDLALAEV